jgi:hypothetical protein
MDLETIAAMLEASGTPFVFVSARAKPIIRNVRVRFNNSSERLRRRKLRKIWERRNASKIKLKHKRYEQRMKHRKPNPILSKRAKQVALKYKSQR